MKRVMIVLTALFAATCSACVAEASEMLSPSQIGDSGGETLVITGDWAAGVQHAVTIGGVPALRPDGSPGTVAPGADGALRVITPPVALSAAAEVLVTPAGDDDVDAGDVAVLRRRRHTGVADFAALFPSAWYLGLSVPRDLDQGDLLGAFVPVPLLDAIVEAVGEDLGGHVYTRLTAPLVPGLLGAEPGDNSHVVADVETGLGFAAGDTVLIGDETVVVGGTTGTSLTSLTRDDSNAVTWPTGTPVIKTRGLGVMQDAFDALDISRATGGDLDALAARFGIERGPWFQDDDAFRVFVRLVAYMRGRASRHGIEQVLDAVLTPGASGTEAEVSAQTLTDASAPFRDGMKDLRVQIGGVRYRIAEVVSATEVTLDARGGDQWAAADFDEAEDVEWQLVPYDLLSGPQWAATAVVRINGAFRIEPRGGFYFNARAPRMPLGPVFDPEQAGYELIFVSPGQLAVDVPHQVRQVTGCFAVNDNDGDGIVNYCVDNDFDNDEPGVAFDGGSRIFLDDISSATAVVIAELNSAADFTDDFDVSDIEGTSDASATFTIRDRKGNRIPAAVYFTHFDDGVLPHWRVHLVIDGVYMAGGVSGVPAVHDAGTLYFVPQDTPLLVDGALINVENNVVNIDFATGTTEVEFWYGSPTDEGGSGVDGTTESPIFVPSTVTRADAKGLPFPGERTITEVSLTGFLSDNVAVPVTDFDPHNPMDTAALWGQVSLPDSTGTLYAAHVYFARSDSTKFKAYLMINGGSLRGGVDGVPVAFPAGELRFVASGAPVLPGALITPGSVDVEIPWEGLHPTTVRLIYGNAVFDGGNGGGGITLDDDFAGDLEATVTSYFTIAGRVITPTITLTGVLDGPVSGPFDVSNPAGTSNLGIGITLKDSGDNEHDAALYLSALDASTWAVNLVVDYGDAVGAGDTVYAFDDVVFDVGGDGSVTSGGTSTVTVDWPAGPVDVVLDISAVVSNDVDPAVVEFDVDNTIEVLGRITPHYGIVANADDAEAGDDGFAGGAASGQLLGTAAASGADAFPIYLSPTLNDIRPDDPLALLLRQFIAAGIDLRFQRHHW
ncbi:MAG: hypothetical protein EKK55_19280 [Rhodocyclaceae bacterium]|nr:MAG: hypothetical protein EKK55_19280 [Rhodocyclaceae bacterium]